MPSPDHVFGELSRALPPVVLFLGPRPPELYGLAARLVTHHRVHRSDIVEHYGVGLTAAEARGLVAYAGIASYGPFKAVILGLDGVSEQAQNILLKVLEEPPGQIRFLLFARTAPLPTVVSRARVYRFGQVSDNEEQPADGPVKARVAAALRAASAHDEETLASVLAGWNDDCQSLLAAWAAEAAAGRWAKHGGLFPEWQHASRHRALAVLEGLARYPRARPANAAAVALGQAFGKETP